MSVPTDLANAARCWASCVPPGEQSALKTYLLAQASFLSSCSPPLAPTTLTVLVTTTSTISFSWAQPLSIPPVAVGSYVVKWGSSSGNYNLGSATVGPTPTSYTITGLSASQSVYIVVEAIGADGCPGGTSAELSTSTSADICAAGIAFASAWAARVVANGGAAPSQATQNAIANFQCGLISDGLDTQMVSWNAIAPDSLIASITPQLIGGGNDPWTNHNFLAADLSVDGLIGDFATKFLDTGLKPSVVFPADTEGGFTVYMFANAANSDGVWIGSSQNDACVHAMVLQKSGGTTFLDLYGCNTGRISAADAAFVGYISGNRTAANAEAIYEASSTIPHNTLVSGVGAGNSRPTINLFVWAFNVLGVANAFARSRMSFIAVHHGLTSAQSALFYARIQTLRTALGGGFI